MSKNNNATEIILTRVRGSFLDIFEAKAFNDGAPRFSGTWLIAKNDPQVKTIMAAMKAAARGKWGSKADIQMKQLAQMDRLALHDGDLKTDSSGETLDGYADHFYVNSGTKQDAPPIVYSADGTRIDDPAKRAAHVDGIPYNGCYCHVRINMWAQDNQWGRRVNAGLLAVVFAEDGESFGKTRATEAGTVDAFAAAGITVGGAEMPDNYDPDDNEGGDDESDVDEDGDDLSALLGG